MPRLLLNFRKLVGLKVRDRNLCVIHVLVVVQLADRCRLVHRKLEENLLCVRVQVEVRRAVSFQIHLPKLLELAAEAGRSNLTHFVGRAGLSVSVWILLEELLVVALVAIEVLRARNARLQQQHDGEEHLTRHSLDDLFELDEIETLATAKHFFNHGEDLFLSLEPVKENLVAAAFHGELAL